MLSSRYPSALSEHGRNSSARMKSSRVHMEEGARYRLKRKVRLRTSRQKSWQRQWEMGKLGNGRLRISSSSPRSYTLCIEIRYSLPFADELLIRIMSVPAKCIEAGGRFDSKTRTPLQGKRRNETRRMVQNARSSRALTDRRATPFPLPDQSSTPSIVVVASAVWKFCFCSHDNSTITATSLVVSTSRNVDRLVSETSFSL